METVSSLSLHVPEILQYGLALLLGLSLGSFYTALASRIAYFFYGPGRKKNKQQDTAKTHTIATKTAVNRKSKRELWLDILALPSFCFHCKKTLRLPELLPLWGYLRNGGRCRYCKQSIGYWTLLGELYLGLLLPFSLFYQQNWLSVIFSLLFCGHLYISMTTDSHWFILDAENTLFLFVWGIAYLLAYNGYNLEYLQGNLLAFAGTLLLFGFIFLFGRFRSLGLGDVILACAISLVLSLPWSLLVFQLAAGSSIIYIFLVQRNLRAPAPLGAAMALSTLLVFPISMAWQ